MFDAFSVLSYHLVLEELAIHNIPHPVAFCVFWRLPPTALCHEPLRDRARFGTHCTRIWAPSYPKAAQAPGPKNTLLERRRLVQQLGRRRRLTQQLERRG